MEMADASQVAVVRLQLHGDGYLGDHFRRPYANHVPAQDLAVLPGHDKLEGALVRTQRDTPQARRQLTVAGGHGEAPRHGRPRAGRLYSLLSADVNAAILGGSSGVSTVSGGP